MTWLRQRLGGQVSSRPVAVARIGVALATLLELPPTALAMLRVATGESLRAPWFDVSGSSLSEPVTWALIVGWLGCGVAFLVGWRTRLAGVGLALGMAGVLFADRQLYSNHLYLMILAVGLLTTADAGAALSLDSGRHREREQVAVWPVFLLKMQLSIVYVFSAMAKLTPAYLSGSVVAASLRVDGPLAFPQEWRIFEPMFVLAVLAICSELFVGLGLWSRRWRPAAIVVGLGLHGFIAGWLSPTYQLVVFGLLMLPLYLVFLDAARGSRLVVWDDGCGFCAGWVRWFRRLDWLDALRPLPRSGLAGSGLPVTEDATLEALHLVTPRRVYRGFAAVARIAEMLPVSFAWAPLLRIPPLAALGERTYRRVAAGRSCALAGIRPGDRDATAGVPIR
jgi:predicted DCC family thiol-disulfide oxidoreductase YuxK